MTKPSAAARTMGMFGDEPKRAPTFEAPERERASGYAPPPPGQVGLFGPQQVEFGDKERIERSKAWASKNGNGNGKKNGERAAERVKLAENIAGMESNIASAVEPGIAEERSKIERAKKEIARLEKHKRELEASIARDRKKLRGLT